MEKADEIKLRGRKKKIVYALDWNAQKYSDRLACVQELEKRGSLEDLGPGQLNEISNYLLYSSDVNCDVELKKAPKKQSSYEELVENGVADMALYNSKYKNIYKTIRPSIDRDRDKDIPGMEELWEEIEKVKKIYDYLDDCLKGRREKDFDNPLEISYVNHYFYKNWYIDLCLNQYTLKDFYNPIMNTKLMDYRNYIKEEEIYFGIRAGKYIYNESEEEKMIDLGNPVHVYLLLRNYKAIKMGHMDSTIDSWNQLYDLLDEAIAECSFNDCVWEVLELKVNGEHNDIIGKYIRDKYNVKYNDNYISTLFTKSISRKIAKKAISNAGRKFHDIKPKKCPKCKEMRYEDDFYSFAKPCIYCLKKNKNKNRVIKLWS